MSLIDFFKVDERFGEKDIKKFAFALAVFCAVIAGLLYRKHREVEYFYLLGVSGLLSGLALLAPRALTPLFAVWMKVGHVLGWVNTRLLLMLIYYIVFTPVSLVLRLLGRDLLDIKIDEKAVTYWQARDESGWEKSACEKQF